MELRSSGDALQALPLCLKRSGALEACCACRDVEEAEVWSSSVWRRVNRLGAKFSGACQRCLGRYANKQGVPVKFSGLCQ